MNGSVHRMLLIRRPGIALTRICLFATFAAIGSGNATAQTAGPFDDVDSPGLVIEAEVGWDGTVDRSAPVPLSFLLRNDSDQIIEGHLRLSSPDGNAMTLGEVVIAPGTTRRFTSIQDMSDWYRCFATLSDGDRVLWRRELALVTGNEFDANVNVVLFVDDGGRRLEFPGTPAAAPAVSVSEYVIAGTQGQPVQTLTVKPWQVPNHPGPLIVAQAIVFPESASADELNQVQWKAVSEWMCQGGVVFVHNESSGIIEQLIDSAPLIADPAVESGSFRVRRVGLGAIYEHPTLLLSSADDEGRQRIAETIARLSRRHIASLVDVGNLYHRRGGRADLNRGLVVGFFLGYTVLAGLVAILLFKLSQRRIGIYTAVVVIGATVLSGLLGGLLRSSRGDLRWMSITQSGAGGLVQVGSIEVQSAGGRNTRVAVSGSHPDLQFIGRDRYFYSSNQQQSGCHAFTWQPDLAPDAEETYQIEVPITPWGRRRCQATAYEPGSARLDFELGFPSQTRPGRNGISLKLVNHLPFALTECWLIVGATDSSGQSVDSMQSVPVESLLLPAAPGDVPSADGNVLIDVYHMRQLEDLPAGATVDESFDAEFRFVRYNWDFARSMSNGSITPPRIPHLGTASAWIIGRIEESPILSIDPQRSQFVPQEELHFYIQEIRPEDLLQ